MDVCKKSSMPILTLCLLWGNSLNAAVCLSLFFPSFDLALDYILPPSFITLSWCTTNELFYSWPKKQKKSDGTFCSHNLLCYMLEEITTQHVIIRNIQCEKTMDYFTLDRYMLSWILLTVSRTAVNQVSPLTLFLNSPFSHGKKEICCPACQRVKWMVLPCVLSKLSFHLWFL